MTDPSNLIKAINTFTAQLSTTAALMVTDPDCATLGHNQLLHTIYKAQEQLIQVRSRLQHLAQRKT